MSAADDAEVLEALIRSEMARVAALGPAASRGGFDSINARRFLLDRIDGLLDQWHWAQLRALVEALDSDEECEGA
jgi:hypothetical protein